jgi:hypothetical protein
MLKCNAGIVIVIAIAVIVVVVDAVWSIGVTIQYFIDTIAPAVAIGANGAIGTKTGSPLHMIG